MSYAPVKVRRGQLWGQLTWHSLENANTCEACWLRFNGVWPTTSLGTAVRVRMRILTAAAFAPTSLIGSLARVAAAAPTADSTANDPCGARAVMRSL